MKKELLTLTVVLLAFFLQGCQDDFTCPVPAARSYQEDALILNKFVEINKTTHEYRINPNKRNSVLSYITNADVEELNSVNTLNLKSFNQSLDRINNLSTQLANNHSVDYIIMITENDVYVSQIQATSPVNIKQQKTDNNYFPTIASFSVTDSKKQYYASNNNVKMSVELKPQSYKNAGWAFLITCNLINNGDKKTIQVLFCGVGCDMTSLPCFEWTTVQNNDKVWSFEIISLNRDIPYIADFKFLR